jgi:DNA-binding NarL/FixJ family response regulator
MAPAPPVRILVLADDLLSRAGLAALLGEEAGFRVIAQADLGPDGAAALAVVEPDLVVVDLGWDAELALARLAALDVARPLALLLPGDAALPAAWALRPHAVLGRGIGGPRLAAALAAVAEGLWVAEPALAPAPEPPAASVAEATADVALTARELDVLRLLAEGLPNKAIAHQLGISEHTVKFHVNAVLGKLGAASRTEAAMRAARLGLVV